MSVDIKCRIRSFVQANKYPKYKKLCGQFHNDYRLDLAVYYSPSIHSKIKAIYYNLFDGEKVKEQARMIFDDGGIKALMAAYYIINEYSPLIFIDEGENFSECGKALDHYFTGIGSWVA